MSDPNITFSPYNWVRESDYAQTPNPGAYLKVGFTGTSVRVTFDGTALSKAGVPASQYPLVRASIDGGPGTTYQIKSGIQTIDCAVHLNSGNHTLRLEYVSGYVFLDFWTPVNVVRVNSIKLDEVARTFRADTAKKNVLFLGDSITNGDDDVANFKDGITNAVETQDATLGYPSVVAKAINAEYGISAYGGASWDRKAADGNTPGVMTFWSMIDKEHSRLRNGKLWPVPDEIYVNMGENAGPTSDDVPQLLTALRSVSSPRTEIFLIIPFSGRSRASLTAGFKNTKSDPHTFLMDTGNNAHLAGVGPTLMSVDGQHPLAALHAQLGARLVEARAKALVAIGN